MYYKLRNTFSGMRQWKLGCIRAVITCVNLAYLPLTVAMLQVILQEYDHTIIEFQGISMCKGFTYRRKLHGILSMDKMFHG